MELFSTFGIDWRLLLWQAVNFAVVLFVLKRFAIGPLIATLERRRVKIEEGLREAEAARKVLSDAETGRDGTLREAREKAGTILAEARAHSERLQEDLLAKARAEAAKILADGKASLTAEKDAMLRSAKAEVADLVVLAAAKAVPRVLTERDRETLLTEAAKAVAEL